MRFDEKHIRLRDGRGAVLRSPTPEDAVNMLEFVKTTAMETEFVIRYPEECTETAEQEASLLQKILDSDLNMMIACEVDGRIAGSCQIMFQGRLKTRHRAAVAIALVREYWGLGIGSAMFEELIRAAKVNGATQMELEVIEGNHRAMGLYEKYGFRVVGERPNAIRLKDGTMLREFLMVKTLQLEER